METTRLYFDDPDLRVFTATIINRRIRSNRPDVALDRTALYPEGGGQPADWGALSGVRVVDVQAEAGVIWHTLERSLPVTDQVEGSVDDARRRDHTQQHHGQHLLSAAFENLFGHRTVSFHLGSATSTIDLAASEVTPDELRAAEALANQVIREARPVVARFISPEELGTVTLRKPPTIDGPVRVVSVPDFDHSACGGTHPRTTGGVGALVVYRTERRGMETRVEFVCGDRVVQDLRKRSDILQRTAGSLSVAFDELDSVVARLMAKEAASRRRADTLERQILDHLAADSLTKAERLGPDAVRFIERVERELTPDTARYFAQQVAHAGAVAVLGVSDGEKHQLFITCGETVPIDAAAVLREAVTACGGRGGGQRGQAQGGVPTAVALAKAQQLAADAIRASLAGS